MTANLHLSVGCPLGDRGETRGRGFWYQCWEGNNASYHSCSNTLCLSQHPPLFSHFVTFCLFSVINVSCCSPFALSLPSEGSCYSQSLEPLTHQHAPSLSPHYLPYKDCFPNRLEDSLMYHPVWALQPPFVSVNACSCLPAPRLLCSMTDYLLLNF